MMVQHAAMQTTITLPAAACCRGHGCVCVRGALAPSTHPCTAGAAVRDSCIMGLQQMTRLEGLMQMQQATMTVAVLLRLCGRVRAVWLVWLHARVPACKGWGLLPHQWAALHSRMECYSAAVAVLPVQGRLELPRAGCAV